MTYQEYRKAEQDAFNSLPIFFAFSNKQFEEEMNKRGLTSADTDKIYSNGHFFYLRTDAEKIHEFMNKEDKLPELMKDTDFAESAFYYEMANHEYHINWQADWDVCSCFGECEYGECKDYNDYLKECGYDEQIIRSYRMAKHKFLDAADENGWY